MKKHWIVTTESKCVRTYLVAAETKSDANDLVEDQQVDELDCIDIDEPTGEEVLRDATYEHKPADNC